MSIASPDSISAMPGRITVVRHGTTEWSRAGRHTGKTDLPLLPEGETAALALAKSLLSLAPPVTPVIVLTSPLRRARMTCDLAGYGGVAKLEPRLAEWDYGVYEGLTTAEIRERQPDWDLFQDGCPEGETATAVGKRVDGLLDELRSQSALEGKEVLCFSHGHLLRVLAARWIGLPPAEARHLELSAGGIGRLGWEHEWRTVELWNR